MPPCQPTQSTSLSGFLSLYADMGYHLTPLNGKKPYLPDWPKSAYNPFPQPEQFPSGNFGVVLQPDDLVIDVDPRNFKNGVDCFKDLEIALETTLEGSTFSVLAGSNGLHLYFKILPQLEIKKSLPQFAGVEF